MADANGVLVHSSKKKRGGIRAVSPDGESMLTYGPTERPVWLNKVWPIKDDDMTWKLIHWRSGVEQGRFRNAKHIVFSPGNELLVVQRGGSIEGYALPLRAPWLVLAGWSLGAAAVVWCAGWLWSRRRDRSPKR
jgi:hypothetical protein